MGKHLERQYGRRRGEEEEKSGRRGRKRKEKEEGGEKGKGAKRSKSGEPDNMPRLATKRGKEKFERGRVGVKRGDEKAYQGERRIRGERKNIVKQKGMKRGKH